MSLASHDLALLERRTAAARRIVAGDAVAAARIEDAPAWYLLVHDSGDVARHVGLLAPVPQPGEVRVLVTPGHRAGEWLVDVAAHDRPGLFAAMTGVLAERRIDVVQAVLATWDDGAALEAFVVRAAAPPDAAELRASFAMSLAAPVQAPALVGAEVAFDAGASSRFTGCEVRVPDSAGVLHALAVAFAAAGADVHAARVVTVGGMACDRFDLTDRDGRKLPPATEAAIRRHLEAGARVDMAVAPRRRGRRGRRLPRPA